MGPWQMRDCTNLETAILMLWKSLDKGAKGRDYCQFDTIQKIRTLRENIHAGSANGIHDNWSFTDQKGRVYFMDQSHFTRSGLDYSARAVNLVWGTSLHKMQLLL